MKKTRSIILISGNGSNLDNIVNKVTSGFIDMDICMVIQDFLVLFHDSQKNFQNQ